MQLRNAFALCFLLASGGGVAAQATDPNQARAVAASCAGCHGPKGVAQGDMPALAGRSKEELVRKMQEFKAGRAPATVMQQLAKGYTDEQIDLAATWFAAQKP